MTTMDSKEDDHVAFGDQTKLTPLDVILGDLSDELDADDLIFNEIVNLSRTPLGINRNDVKTGAKYFEILKNNLGEEDMLDFLINVTDFQNWHCDFGNIRVTDRLKKFKDKLEEHKRKCMQKDIFDPNFVGRDKEIEDIISLMENTSTTVTGVSIWGAGGIGKTTLGNEICRRLWAHWGHWQVIKVDLREKDSLGDLFKDIILELQQKDDGMNTSVDLQNSLQNTMDRKLQATIVDQLGRTSRRTIVMLDNVDDIVNNKETEFLQFVLELLKKLREKKRVRVIITSRINLLCGTSKKTISDLRELMRAVKVQRLETHHAKELIKKCTPKDLVSEDECDSLVELTEGNPLALRTLCSILKNCFRQVKPSEVIQHLRSDAEKLSLVGMEKCLWESFGRLDKSMKNFLMQLTLFKTTSFDLEAANAVTEDPPEGKAEKSKVLMTKMNLFHLKSRHLIEIQDLTIQTEGEDKVQNRRWRPRELGDSSRKVLYSLHPLVLEFLSKQRSKFPDVMKTAKVRFFKYMERIISKIGEEQENSFYIVESILRDYHVHIQSYFEVISEIGRDPEIAAGTLDFNTSNRILEVGRRTLSQKGQLAWLGWVIARAEQKKDNEMWFNFQGYYIQLLTEMDNATDIPDIIQKTEEKLGVTPGKSHMKKTLGNYYYRKALYFKKVDKSQELLDNLEKARGYLEDSENIGPIHAMILANVYNDFGCYNYMKDNDKCKMYHEKAIKKALESRPPGVEDHPDVDMFKNNRAVCLLYDVVNKTLDESSRNEYISEAIEHFSRTIAAKRRFGSDNTESHASALRNRSVLYLQLKKYEEARSDARECLEVRKKFLDEPHEDLTLSYSNIANILYYWGDQRMREHATDEGMWLLQQSVDYFDRALEMIKNRGLFTGHEEYAKIKALHLKAVDRTDKDRKLLLKQEYLDLECSSDSSEDGTSRKSEEESSSDDLLSSDAQRGSSEDEQTDTRQAAETDGQKAFDRPRMTSNTSGSSEDVFTKPSGSQEVSDNDLSEDSIQPRRTSNGSRTSVSSKRRISRDVSLEELMAEVFPKKKKRHSN